MSKSELKRLAIQKGVLSEADKKLVNDLHIQYWVSYESYTISQPELVALLAKVREDLLNELKNCNSSMGLYSLMDEKLKTLELLK